MLQQQPSASGFEIFIYVVCVVILLAAFVFAIYKHSMSVLKSRTYLSHKLDEDNEAKKIRMKNCPYCDEEIRYNAKVCRYCRRDIE